MKPVIDEDEIDAEEIEDDDGAEKINETASVTDTVSENRATENELMSNDGEHTDVAIPLGENAELKLSDNTGKDVSGNKINDAAQSESSFDSVSPNGVPNDGEES